MTRQLLRTPKPIDGEISRREAHPRLSGQRLASLTALRRQLSSSGGRCATPSPLSPSADGQALPAGVRSRVDALQGFDFSRVRVYPNAPDVTTPLQARAVTRGQHIFFHPGEFRPDTRAGDALIAHELAHTRQTRQSGENHDRPAAFVSRPGDALERNADALARGATAHALAAPAGAALRAPLDAESATDRTRRETLIQSISNAIDVLLKLLSSGGLLENTETATERNGVRGVVFATKATGAADEEFISYADRDALLRRIIRTLMAMAKMYRTTPIAADFSAPVKTQINEPTEPERYEYESTVTYPGGSTEYGGKTPEWADLQGAYDRYRRSQGQVAEAFDPDWYYLDPTQKIKPNAARGAPRTTGGIASGAYMVFPDLDNEPLRYWRLDGYSPTPKGSTIVEFWHDDFGYYYTHKGQRIDVPNPWR